MAGTSPAMTPELPLRARIWLAGFVQITHAFFVALRARANLQVDGIPFGPINQTMAVGDAGLEPSRVSRAHHDLAAVFAQHHFAGQHVNEFILGGVPVALR